MKKLFVTVLLMSVLCIPMLNSKIASATELSQKQTPIEQKAETNTITPLNTATYYYWRQTGSSYKEAKYVSDWIEYNRPYASYTGQTYGMIFNHKQAGTISVGITVGKVVAGGLSYTPGTSESITGTATSQPLTGGRTYIAQYRKKELVYYIYQEKWLYDYGFDYSTGETSTGIQSIPTQPDARWILQ